MPTGGSEANRTVQVVPVDLAGAGCAVPLRFDGRHLMLPDLRGQEQRYELSGVARDAILLAGDWNCDGREGIALYLPSSGELLRFEGLPDPGGELRARAQPTGVLDGAPAVVLTALGCAEVLVAPH
jgi:hypothetical protein